MHYKNSMNYIAKFIYMIEDKTFQEYNWESTLVYYYFIFIFWIHFCWYYINEIFVTDCTFAEI